MREIAGLIVLLIIASLVFRWWKFDVWDNAAAKRRALAAERIRLDQLSRSLTLEKNQASENLKESDRLLSRSRQALAQDLGGIVIFGAIGASRGADAEIWIEGDRAEDIERIEIMIDASESPKVHISFHDGSRGAESWQAKLTATTIPRLLNLPAQPRVEAMIDSAVEKALAEQRQQFMEPPPAREQPVGCVVCTCDGDEDRCYGCGAKNCDDPTTCVLRLGDRTKRVYRDAPSYSGLLAKLAKQEARHKREVLKARIESLDHLFESGYISCATTAGVVAKNYIDTLRAELAALDNPKNAADAAMPEEET